MSGVVDCVDVNRGLAVTNAVVSNWGADCLVAGGERAAAARLTDGVLREIGLTEDQFCG